MDATLSSVPAQGDDETEEQQDDSASVTGLEYRDFRLNSEEEQETALYEIVSDEEQQYPEVVPAALRDEFAADRRLRIVQARNKHSLVTSQLNTIKNF